MAKYIVTGKVLGYKKGAVVEFEKLPPAFNGRAQELPRDLTPVKPEPIQTAKKGGDKK